MFKTGLGEGNGTPLQYSCLENPIDRGAWKAAVHGVAEGRTQPSNFTFTFHFHDIIYMWDLEYHTNELIYKTETDSQI